MSDAAASATSRSRRSKRACWALVGRLLAVAGAIAVIGWVGWWADVKDGGSVAHRILLWTFVVFSVGLAELFVVLLAMTILGKIDLAKAFEDKPAPEGSGGRVDPVPGIGEGQGATLPKRSSISLSRLQAFLWTLVVLVLYFHEAVSHEPHGKLPELPPELLLVMGISGATYLVSKQMDRKGGPP